MALVEIIEYADIGRGGTGESRNSGRDAQIYGRRLAVHQLNGGEDVSLDQLTNYVRIKSLAEGDVLVTFDDRAGAQTLSPGEIIDQGVRDVTGPFITAIAADDPA